MKAQRNGQVRIIGGTHRSRVVRFVDAQGLRPTADSVRERLFNWLGQDLSNKNVLDLFSGSGVLAFEAVSRNANKVDMVEKNSTIYRMLNEQKTQLGMEKTHLHRQDALFFLQNHSDYYDVVFLDPPYAWAEWDCLWTALHPRLNKDAWVYIEQGKEFRLPEYLQQIKSGKSGMSHYILAQHQDSKIP